MYELLSSQYPERAGGLALAQYRRVRDGLQQAITKIQAFHRNNPKSLNGSHFLVKLLGSLNISHRLDDDIFVWKVDDWADDLSMALKMTSSIYRGKLFRPGVFYGDKVGEAIIATTDPFDVEDAIEHWQDLQPIRVLTHPFCDFDLAIPNGRGHSVGGGLAVITVNIPMLALQYKIWRRWERSVNQDSPQSIMQFLHMLPIPNMLESQTNIAILNRIMNQYFGGEIPTPKPAHSFYITNWGNEVDDVVSVYLKFIQNKQLTFDNMVGLMPSVGRTMHDTLTLPKQPYSNQLQWAIVVARVVLATFLVQHSDDNENHNNRKYLNYLYRYLKMIEINRGLEQALPRADFDDIMFIINDGIRPYL